MKNLFKWVLFLFFLVTGSAVSFLTWNYALYHWKDRETFQAGHREILEGQRAIESYRQAAEFGLSLSDLKDQLKKCDRVKPEDVWTVSPIFENGSWKVKLKTSYLGFGYRCSIAFDTQGKTLEAARCEYYSNK